MPDAAARFLMEQALAIYDRKGEGTTAAACYLQAAIDAASAAQPLKPGEEIDPDLMAWYETMVRAPAERGHHTAQ